MNLRNIGIFAHVDAGKTTTTEQMLYLSGKIRSLGSVDNGNAVTDYNDLERKRGITIYADEVNFIWKDTHINLIDTPGHIDFYPEVQRSLLAIDGAILIISALEGVKGNTETLWRELKLNNVPTVIFLNKIDRTGVEIQCSLENIKSNLSSDILLINDNTFSTENLDDLIELISHKNEVFLERYLNGEAILKEELEGEIKAQCKAGYIYPVVLGSAIEGKGVENLLDCITDFLPNPKESLKNKKLLESMDHNNSSLKNVSLVYKLRQDKTEGLLSYVKVIKGSLKPRQSFYFGENNIENKINSIRKYMGQKFITLESLEEGDIGVVSGLKNSHIGDLLKESSIDNILPNDRGFLSSKIICNDEDSYNKLLEALNILALEDPTLNPQYVNNMKEVIVDIRGIIHMDVLKEVLENRFNLNIDFASPTVTFLETISEKSTGFCHYEPKKHYGEVELEISPLERGAGIKYSSALSLDILPSQFQNIIEKNIEDAVKHGILINSMITDVDIKLIGGSHDLEHTHGGDFRIATIRALQQGLEKNKCILLEPLYKFNIIAPIDYMGKIISDITRMKGSFNEPLMDEHKFELTGEVPIQTSMNYPIELMSSTSSKASIALSFSRYEVCHNEEEILQNPENKLYKDEALYNSISLLRENRKMKKVY